MAFTNEQHRKRYADDKEHRARKLADNKVWRTEHSKELNAAWSERWRTDPEFRASKQAQRRLRKYGLTPEQYRRMVDESNGLCMICKLTHAACASIMITGRKRCADCRAAIATAGSAFSPTIRSGCGRQRTMWTAPTASLGRACLGLPCAQRSSFAPRRGIFSSVARTQEGARRLPRPARPVQAGTSVVLCL